MYGSIAEIALAIQSAKGTAAASSTFRMPVVAGQPEVVSAVQAGPGVRSTRIAGDPWRPVPYGAGDVTCVLRPRAIGALLYAALGAKAVSGASDPWTHTITLGATLPWLTVWRHLAGGLNERFVDCRLSKLTISSQHGSPVQVTFGIVSGSPRYRTTQETTATLETTQHFEHVHGSAALLLEGTAYRTIESWVLSIDTGVGIEQTIGGPVARQQGRARIGLQATYRPADAALWRRVVYGSASPANDAVAVSTPLELAGSPAGVQFTLTAALGPERSLRIAIPRVTVDPMAMQPNTRGDVLRNTIALQAFATTTPITATLKNGVSAY